MDTSIAAEVARTFAPVGFALHAVMPEAVDRANQMMKLGGMSPVEYPSQFAHNIVGVTHNLLKVADLSDWVLDERAERKQLHLSRDLWTTRFLAQGYQGVPTAGSNASRRAFYTNSVVTEQTPAAALLEEHCFIIVWWIDPRSKEVRLELVHTFQPWAPGQTERVDLRMPLAADGIELANLRFSPPPDDDLLDGLGLIDRRGNFRTGVIGNRGVSS